MIGNECDEACKEAAAIEKAKLYDYGDSPLDYIWHNEAKGMKYLLYWTYATIIIQCVLCICTCGGVGLPKLGASR